MSAVRIFSDLLGMGWVVWAPGFETPGFRHRLQNQELIDAKPFSRSGAAV